MKGEVAGLVPPLELQTSFLPGGMMVHPFVQSAR